ncbi:3-oxoacyl-[acyl-carrier-protein] synthase III C-terminal domain-containing protein [Flavobacterium aquiphilum]|uniref:3-oxoacyl-[acyl-carrier-protein] synthase III C-terminal domain-containing protein n=1 Tax=Flavobacterium aquiphilum TaxID=3003261 RepID=UPI003D7A9D62
MSSSNIDWVIPNQVNLRIIEVVRSNLGIDKSRIKINIQKYENITSTTTLLCLWDFKDDFGIGQNVLITTFASVFHR